MASPGLNIVRDTIYQLKKEYGLKIALMKATSTNNIETGLKTTTYQTQIINKAILLPRSANELFRQLVNQSKVGIYENDSETVIIDKKDVSSFTPTVECFIGYHGSALSYVNLNGVDWNNLDTYNINHSSDFRRYNIKSVEDSLFAFLVKVQGVNLV